MVDTSKKITVEASCGELFQMVNGLIFIANEYIERTAPEVLITKTVARAKKFNDVLISAGYDHFTDDMFEQLMSKCANRGAKDE